jgi:hypothetical protein
VLPIFSGVIVAVSVGAGAAVAAIVWSHRRPLVWLPDSVDGPARLSNPNYAEWLSLKNQFEAMMNATFAWWAIAGIALGVLIAIMPFALRLSTRSTVLTTLGALCIAVIAEAGLLAYLELGEHTVALWAIQLVVIAGRVGLVIVALMGFAGLWAQRRSSPGASSRARRASRRAALQ